MGCAIVCTMAPATVREAHHAECQGELHEAADVLRLRRGVRRRVVDDLQGHLERPGAVAAQETHRAPAPIRGVQQVADLLLGHLELCGRGLDEVQRPGGEVRGLEVLLRRDAALRRRERLDLVSLRRGVDEPL